MGGWGHFPHQSRNDQIPFQKSVQPVRTLFTKLLFISREILYSHFYLKCEKAQKKPILKPTLRTLTNETISL